MSRTSSPPPSSENAGTLPASLPRILFPKDISALTGLSVGTIRHYTGNSEEFGHLLPKWFKLPGSQRLLWKESDVADFLRNAYEQYGQPKKRRRGRPTKRETMARQLQTSDEVGPC